ncbi:MAG: hypothetical protein GVY14_02485 [Spirochaetes bacterium]|jgi:hypothetical protein|nr:hypothetical protein [Spirochaetota bacterium]
MTTHEKERLGLALAVSLVIHAVAFFIVQFGDWRVAPMPEFSGPLYVEMEAPEEEPETEEGIARAEPSPEDQVREPATEAPAAEPPPRQPAPEQPAPEEPTPATAQPRQSEPPARAEPENRQSAPDAGASAPADPLAGPSQTGEFDPMAPDGQERQPGQRTAPPQDDEMPQLQPEAAATAAAADLPDWATRPRETVEDAGISTEGVSEDEMQDLAEKVATDPDFRRRLQDVTAALERRTSDGAATERAPRDGPDTGPEDEASPEGRTPGDSRFEWVGTGNRQLLNPPAVPPDFFSSGDFGGQVPAEASFVVVFEVDQRGNIVPGSIIFQRGSGYLDAKEKLRGRIREWSFERTAPNEEDATGIFTLVVQREDIQ